MAFFIMLILLGAIIQFLPPLIRNIAILMALSFALYFLTLVIKFYPKH